MNTLDGLKDPGRLAFILNLPSLPPSVRDVDCSSDAITDVIISCAFAINPKDFEQLLAGWELDEPASGTGSYLDYPNLGREFDIGVRYRVQPPSFERGGVVELLSNADKTRAVASRYEE
ncbi:hypothetical protein ATY81_23150 [Rhizobium sp. R72]|uniref:hypothetical protein n=1 Tax=unclassified Rhizobium TaxID=2613769 RepID=UPI000B52E5FF|nr:MULTISPECIES: hypothetical protein [unclassified Rhizobium]OWW01855.1 hypothetical protein ATY81_23150 [Rhizobium sp. R72]OWW01958.1 hypothetical protein ATY80_23150 [Rhizobium sp. R711]